MTTPTSEQVMQWYNNAAKLKTGEFTETLDLASFAALARADPEATVKEQAAEIERLNGRIFTLEQCREANRNDLAAAQLHIEKLREAFEMVAEAMCCKKKDHLPGRCESTKKIAFKALSTQPDLSALEAERQRVAAACAKWVESEEAKAGGQELSALWYAKHLRAGQWKDHMK